MLIAAKLCYKHLESGLEKKKKSWEQHPGQPALAAGALTTVHVDGHPMFVKLINIMVGCHSSLLPELSEAALTA